MRTPKHGSGRGGFTLVEILAAVVLLSIGLLAVLSASRAAHDTQRRALFLSTGRNIAQTRIETLRAAAFNTLPGLAGTTTDSSLPAGNQVQIAVDGYPNGTETNLYRAIVTVTWPEGNGTRKVRYETLIVRK